ncbi:phosphorylase, partial [Methylogaea oryzae]
GASALLSWGCCAALAPQLSPGALLLPEALLDRERRIHSDQAWRERLHAALSPHLTVRGGALTQSADIVATPADKAALAQASGAIGVDMESAAVAHVAHHRRIPFVAIRAVADPLGMALPHAVLENTDEDGDTRIGGLLLSLARRPTELPALLSLGRHFSAAMASLRHTAKLAGPDFLLKP